MRLITKWLSPISKRHFEIHWDYPKCSELFKDVTHCELLHYPRNAIAYDANTEKKPKILRITLNSSLVAVTNVSPWYVGLSGIVILKEHVGLNIEETSERRAGEVGQNGCAEKHAHSFRRLKMKNSIHECSIDKTINPIPDACHVNKCHWKMQS